MNATLQKLSGFEPTLQKVALVIGRLTLGYLFFTQLWWKTPPTFGCQPGFAFTTGGPDASGRVQLTRTAGLCDWIGIESAWSTAKRPILVSNLDNTGPGEIAVDIGLVARLNGLFIDGFVKPNIGWFGYVIWGIEAFIFISLFFGLLSRLGGLVAIAQSAQLWIGLAGIASPAEWEWSYNWMPVLSFLVFAFAPGRIFGLDAALRPRLAAATARGSKLATALSWLT